MPISILRGLKDRYEAGGGGGVGDEAVIAAVDLSQRYITDRFLPDKAMIFKNFGLVKSNSAPQEINDVETDQISEQLEIEKELSRGKEMIRN